MKKFRDSRRGLPDSLSELPSNIPTDPVIFPAGVADDSKPEPETERSKSGNLIIKLTRLSGHSFHPH
ncbi:MAG TPA: hypothetical protein VNQ90_04320 [Chthoniobacteraceae bacterium]|nr:hypothetical protein [Chthoniobacteraceae bacterium]